MTIQEIYKKFVIPDHLREHMLTVGKVVLFIRDHWIGQKLDWDLLIKAALLHDIGNIVRFDFTNYSHLLGKQTNNLDYWIHLRDEMIKKYGQDDHEATEKMLKELALNRKVIDIILDKSFGNSVKINKSNDWYIKILAYADNRVTPSGVSTLEERLSDIRIRAEKYKSRPDFEDLINACRELEKQIQNNLDVPVDCLSPDSINEIDSDLSNFLI